MCMMDQQELPCCGITPVLRLKALPHVYGADFDLFRCVRCSKAWVGYWYSAGSCGGWEPVSDTVAEKMMSIMDETESLAFMKEWAKAFD